MAQKKLLRFEAIKSFPNVLQYPEGMAGSWKEFFKNNNPLTLELACGKGEYTVGLARLYADRNFIGVDLKGNRIFIGARTGLEQNIHNAAFLRTHIDKIDSYFSANEVEEIWITFPDPQLRISRQKKRLTHPRFLRLYQKILIAGGKINLKTDSPVLYNYTKTVAGMYGLRVLVDNNNIYANSTVAPELSIKTHYEQLDIARSNTVYFLCLQLPPGPLPDIDEKLYEIVRKNEEGNR